MWDQALENGFNDKNISTPQKFTEQEIKKINEWKSLSGLSEVSQDATMDAIKVQKIPADTEGQDQENKHVEDDDITIKINKLIELKGKLEKICDKISTMENTENTENTLLDKKVKELEEEITEISNSFIKVS